MRVDVQEVQAELSRYLEVMESGQESEIVILRQGKPVARMTAYRERPVSKRIGVARGKLKVPEDLDQYHGELAALFEVEE